MSNESDNLLNDMEKLLNAVKNKNKSKSQLAINKDSSKIWTSSSGVPRNYKNQILFFVVVVVVVEFI